MPTGIDKEVPDGGGELRSGKGALDFMVVSEVNREFFGASCSLVTEILSRGAEEPSSAGLPSWISGVCVTSGYS